MFSTYFAMTPGSLNRLQFGLGGGFTYNKDEYFGVEYSQMFYTVSGLISFKILQKGAVGLILRERIGREFMSVDEYSAAGMVFSTDMLVKYKNLYGNVAVPAFLGKDGTAVDVRIGIGYQLQLY